MFKVCKVFKEISRFKTFEEAVQFVKEVKREGDRTNYIIMHIEDKKETKQWKK